jgi:Fe-S-cluster containining protein
VFPLLLSYPMFEPRMGTLALSSDNAYIADMLISLTQGEADERSDRLGYARIEPSPGQALFTCRHWDEETRLCGAYDTRPGMCSKYPYGSPCERGCGYELSAEDMVAFYGEKEQPEPTPFEWSEADDAWVPRDTADWVWDGNKIRRRDDEQRAVAAPAPSGHQDADRDA